ncbi:MAG: metalloregulator ArsR/SmtB family transcription factor [Pseudomonadota bacterium]
MNRDDAATALAALGHPARLDVFRLLVRAGEAGVTVGEIAQRLGLPASTLAHHLRALTGASLVVQEKQGRETLCRAGFDRMDGLVTYLTEECCTGLPANHDAA